MSKKKMTFAGAMSKAPAKVWQEARKAEPGGKRQLPEIEDGVYPCKAKNAKAGVDGKGNPYVAYGLFVLEGAYEGVRLDQFRGIKDMAKDLPYIVKDFKAMGYEINDDDDDPGVLIEGIVKDINDTEPEVMVSVKNDTYVATKDGDDYKKGDEVRTLRVYVNRPRSEEEGAGQPKAQAKTAKKAPAKKTARK